jgi:sterol desaturase/sphingolipid hydroxylase (fatty acid hydroxylase superfamily)
VRDLRLMQKYYFHNVTIGKQKKWNFGKSFLSLWKILFQSYDGIPST